MNTLTENELVEISALGDGMPVASWPAAGPVFPAPNLSWLNGLVTANNLSEHRMAD